MKAPFLYLGARVGSFMYLGKVSFTRCRCSAEAAIPTRLTCTTPARLYSGGLKGTFTASDVTKAPFTA